MNEHDGATNGRCTEHPGQRTRTDAAGGIDRISAPKPPDSGELGRLRTRLDAVERERSELWQWVHQLERWAEAGLQARGLAHDLGNTLTSLMARCELALLDQEDPTASDALQRALTLSRDASRRLHAYVEFLQHSGTEGRAVDLATVAEDALHLVAHPIRKTGTIVQRALPRGVLVSCERAAATQAVVNALLTTLDGTVSPGDLLRVSVAEEGEDATVAMERIPTVGRAATAGSRGWRHEGTGLGLEVARRAVADAGGRLETRAGGATLRLPLARFRPPAGDHAFDRSALSTVRKQNRLR